MVLAWIFQDLGDFSAAPSTGNRRKPLMKEIV